MKKFKIIRNIILFLAALLVSLWLLQRLLIPKYIEDNEEGVLSAEYYDNAGDNDVLFIGDCEVYCNFSPIKLWQDYGITSVIRGTPQQLIWQSYYMLEDTLRYETPKVVVYNVFSMRYDEPQSGAYTYHMNADQNTMKVIGIIGNDWYHVWFPATGEYGFVRQSDLTTGNG